MAERYAPGCQRIFYRSANFTTDLVVTAKLIDPDLNDVSISLEETNKVRIPGLYHFDFCFREGNYIVYFYEEDILKWSQAYSIRKNVEGGFRSFLGDNVINT